MTERTLDPGTPLTQDLFEPGDTVSLPPGEYSAPKWFESFKDITLQGTGTSAFDVTILRGSQDTLRFVSPRDCSGSTIRNLTVQGSPRGAIFFDTAYGEHFYEDWFLSDVRCMGGWSAVTNSGDVSKWGLFGNRISGLVAQSCHFSGFVLEHGSYLHNSGDKAILFDLCFFADNGRTGFQEANRIGPKGENGSVQPHADLRIRRCTFENNGMGGGGGAITVTGRRGPIIIEDTQVKCGVNGGGLVISPEYYPKEGKMGTPSLAALIKNTRFEGGPSVRPVVRISALDYFLSMKYCEIVRGKNPTAVELDPDYDSLAGGKFPIGQIIDWESVAVTGKMMYKDVDVSRLVGAEL